MTREKLICQLKSQNFLIGLWLLIGLFAGIIKYFHGPVSGFNNYLIFKGYFFHFIDQLPLYIPYPNEYFDQGYYLPPFSILIAPFALLPNYLGMPLWVLANSAFLTYAVLKLPLNNTQKAIVFWLCAHELLTAAFMQQFNISIAAIIILAYVYVKDGKDMWATFFIIFGTFIKLYGIVGCAFFLFSKNKMKFILYMIMWSSLFLVLPALFTSPQYIIEQYNCWFEQLLAKNSNNLYATHQNISLLGIIRKTTHHTMSDLPILLAGVVVFALPYLRIKQWKFDNFKLLILASTLIFPIIFSTSSESSTYIVAIIGVAIWFVIQKQPTFWHWTVLILTLLITSFSPSDLFPAYVNKNFISPYALKALPCVLAWFSIIWELLTKKFDYAD